MRHPGEYRGPRRPATPRPDRAKSNEPGWADGLRTLYNSVVNEPLPDSFEDLLKKLDKGQDE